MATCLFFFLIIFYLFFFFAVASPRTIINATEVLSDSGYLSMGLTLRMVADALNIEFPNLTVFAPSDIAFFLEGQLSLLELQYHISPEALPRESLKTLPYGARIPTLRLNRSLMVTTSTSEGKVSINNVLVEETAIFDDGNLVIYGMGEFFNTSFEFTPSPNPAPEPSPGYSDPSLHQSSGSDIHLFEEASNSLIAAGYTIMATLLDMQLATSIEDTRLTVFAPADEAMTKYLTNFANYSLIFRRHVVPRLLLWKDLARLDDGTALPTLSTGFMINVTWSGDILLLNGVPIISPDMYESSWLAAHGLNQLIISQEKPELVGESFSSFDNRKDDQLDVPDYGEYGS